VSVTGKGRSLALNDTTIAQAVAQTDGGSGTQIVVKDFMFQPMSLQVKAGATVTWLNKDEEPHTVTSDTGLFRSGAIDTNERFSFKFDTAGTYHFTCSIHPRMVGTILVG
jgi:plastocyanin